MEIIGKIIQYDNYNSEIIKCGIQELEKEDEFILYDNDGKRIINNEGKSTFKAIDNPWQDKDGVWKISYIGIDREKSMSEIIKEFLGVL